jgi:hypothetical protein
VTKSIDIQERVAPPRNREVGMSTALDVLRAYSEGSRPIPTEDAWRMVEALRQAGLVIGTVGNDEWAALVEERDRLRAELLALGQRAIVAASR